MIDIDLLEYDFINFNNYINKIKQRILNENGNIIDDLTDDEYLYIEKNIIIYDEIKKYIKCDIFFKMNIQIENLKTETINFLKLIQYN